MKKLPKNFDIIKKHQFKKGHKVPTKWRKNLSKILKGKHNSPNTEFKKGHIMSEGIRNKIRRKMKGNKNGWLGGKSFEPYTTDWTKTLKRAIRERDHYICQLCGEIQNDRAFDCHHIDYDKKNCNPDNLITLCRICNLRANKDRSFWKNYFNAKAIERLFNGVKGRNNN